MGGKRSEGLDRLDVLVGDWVMTASVAGQTTVDARVRMEWIEQGRFLLQRADADAPRADAPRAWHDNFPFPTTMVIGYDDHSGTYSVLYADGRGVSRAYRMSLEGRTWTIWGQAAPEFFQRFVGTIAEDGAVVAGRWERSSDGESWENDFDGTYTRVS